MWVVDEVSVSCENQPPKLLPISVQRAQSVSYWSPTVVIIGAGSAAGEKIPPFLLYHGETITRKYQFSVSNPLHQTLYCSMLVTVVKLNS